jgi:hypothetical protein
MPMPRSSHTYDWKHARANRLPSMPPRPSILYLHSHDTGGFSGGKVVHGMVSQIDIYPTICDLLDIEAPPWLKGRYAPGQGREG